MTEAEQAELLGRITLTTEMKDLAEAGGVPLLMKALLDGGYLHGDCIT